MRSLPALFVGAVVLAAPLLHATVVPLRTEDIARQSSLVVRGVVEETRSRFTTDRSRIVTWAAVRLEETYRGAYSRKRLVVETEGGEAEGIGLVVTDVPRLAKGDRVVLFLEPATADTGRTVFRVVGDAQGAYRVGPDGLARKDGFHPMGDASLVDWEIDVAELGRRARDAR